MYTQFEKHHWFVFGLIGLLPILAGCQTVGPGAASGGALGTLAGGLTGAAIGRYDGKSTEGALVGALTGGTLGSIAGNAVDREAEQNRQQYAGAIAQQRLAAVSIPQVIQMTENGLGNNVIINQIHNQGVDRRPTIDDLIILKNRGVDDNVIQAFQSGPLAGQQSFVHQGPIRAPVHVRTVIPAPAYGYGYGYRPGRRYGRRPRAGFSVNF